MSGNLMTMMDQPGGLAEGLPSPRSAEEAHQRLDETIRRMDAYRDNPVWIYRLLRSEIQHYLDAAIARRDGGIPQPLFGLTFAIKDNIDLAGAPTTAACPDFAYTPNQSATVVQKLIDAGAIPVGKTNLDQFATGLVGVRSPYGAVKNPFNSEYISGGSSSGSAVAVAVGLVDFALGTDTAGSGRVPAAFCNLVGVKPTRGLLSSSGVVPACRSLDCVSIFTRTCTEARQILKVAEGFDPSDIYSRCAAAPAGDQPLPARMSSENFQFGVPQDWQLEFFGNHDAEWLYRRRSSRQSILGGFPLRLTMRRFVKRRSCCIRDRGWRSDIWLAARCWSGARSPCCR